MLGRDPDAIVVIVCDGVEVASWPVPGTRSADLSVVEELARLELAARRLGCSVRLRDPGPGLLELLDLVGLGGLVPGAGALRVEVGREAEDGEQVGVEEVVMPDDPVT